LGRFRPDAEVRSKAGYAFGKKQNCRWTGVGHRRKSPEPFAKKLRERPSAAPASKQTRKQKIEIGKAEIYYAEGQNQF
jgi:hypothetical protein